MRKNPHKLNLNYRFKLFLIAPKGKVPHFTMRPNPAASVMCILVFVSGTLLTLSFFSQEDGTGSYQQKGTISAIITLLLTLFLLLSATARYWFTHLWKKNATHSRHHQHTENHPIEKEKAFRQQLHQRRNRS